ncbi:hypothetical protein TNCT_384751 [Trichonephila clavata]|uniref:Trichohyalin-plectin-homology domain-containing protein n=1 Tax=Trichonephila clavata TaxID=2740835 RepID=A0A8X6HKX4_TRICU|nr:hypothetical protein TNCT_384751 [Trichonephila clavata]
MKKKKQEETKRGLNECVQEKLKRKSKEVQDDLLEDLFFLKQIMETEEEVKKNEKKKALLKEQQGYLKYLQDQMRQEVEFEKEVDKMYQEELENAWERRRKEWQEEKNKRRQREQDVMQGIKEQIMANVEKARLAASMNQEYAHKIFKEDESERRREADKLRLIRERNTQHQRELIDQIRRKELQLEKDQRVRDQELERLRLAREAEEAKIQKLLSEIQIDKEHPYRVARRECFNECRQKEHDCYPTAYKG